ncbi:MAG: hypothetical protein U1E78_13630 [Gammaproteobacteria bacterium]
MEKAAPKKSLVRLHHEIKEISFKHKFLIQKVFKNSVEGILGIDYFSVLVIDSSNTISCYSSMPALEYNLFQSNLWFHDGIFDIKNHQTNSFISWEELYAHEAKSRLIKEKQIQFGFKFGFFIMKKVGRMFVIYSFATKSKNSINLYKESQNVLSKIGDFFLQEIKTIYKEYLRDTQRPKLRLIVNNKRGCI